HGLGGRRFRIWKVRTMRSQRGRQRCRVSAMGSWIRATSIDELPQLLNVIRGEMSLVGPRPHPISLNRKYRGIVAGFHVRHLVKPGMTGLAQMSGARGAIRDAVDMRRRIHLDLSYVERWSLGMDLWILAQTPIRGVLPPLVALVTRTLDASRVDRGVRSNAE